MSRYKITITVNSLPINFSELYISDAALAQFDFTFIDGAPTNTGDTTIGSTINDTAFNLRSTFYGDYNRTGQWSMVVNLNEFIIEGEFTNLPTVITANANITVLIEVVGIVLSILAKDAQIADSSNCDLVDILITTSAPFNELIQPYSEVFADTQTFLIKDQLRNSIVPIRIKDSSSQNVFVTYATPSWLNTGLLSVTLSGSSVVINDSTSGITLTYSLDDNIYQQNNTFPGLANGDYTCYVKDELGCKTTIDFTVSVGVDGAVTIPDPYFYYPNVNCLRVAKREVWDDSAIFKNDFNTLSCESTDRVVHIEKQRWRTTDIINLQVKNNYDDLVMELSNDIGTPIPLLQKTTNLNNKEAMECKITDLGDSKIGVYFISGLTFDYDTLIPNGEYSLNGTLPVWGEKGNILTIGAFNYVIEDVTFNERLQVEQLVIVAVLSAGDSIVKAIYNIFDYEVYEFAIILTLETAPFNLRISYDGKLQYVSELIYSDDVTLNLLSIKYYMDYNTDMFWSTGIQPVIRLQQDLNNASSKRESDSYDTDETSVQIKVNNYRIVIIKFLPITKVLAVNCLAIFSSSNINVMGIDYRCDTIEMESLEESNLYVLTATLQEKDSGISRNSIGSTTLTLPALIKTEDGYIKL